MTKRAFFLTQSYLRAMLLVLAVCGLMVSCSSRRLCLEPSEVVPPFAAADVDSVLFLLGDGGEAEPGGEPALALLGSALDSAVKAFGTERVRVVFLGDNLYPNGLADGEQPELKRKLAAQVQPFESLGAGGSPLGIFVPGNHDWNHSSRDGLRRIRNQAKYLAEKSGGRVHMLPPNGCPGPVVLDIGQHLRLLVLDTQWFLRSGIKSGEADCPDAGSSEAAFNQLRQHLAQAGQRKVVVVGHHPLVSGGPHGGRTSIFRRTGLIPQDVSGRNYKRLRKDLEAVFAEHPPLMYAAGHDHSLQLQRGDGYPYHVVSGAANLSHLTTVVTSDESIYCRSASGLIRLDFATDGRVRFSVHIAEGQEGKVGEVFATHLDR